MHIAQVRNGSGQLHVRKEYAVVQLENVRKKKIMRRMSGI
jgi:hypothetical protein